MYAIYNNNNVQELVQQNKINVVYFPEGVKN